MNLAAQTLSSSVADAIELCQEMQLDGFQDTEATVKFIRMFDKLFDILNSRNPYGRAMKTPLRMENENYWRPFLQEAISYLKSICNVDGIPLWKTTKKVPFIGFLVSTTSVLQIYDQHVVELANLKYILTYKFSQDHLELFFCSVRY